MVEMTDKSFLDATDEMLRRGRILTEFDVEKFKRLLAIARSGQDEIEKRDRQPSPPLAHAMMECSQLNEIRTLKEEIRSLNHWALLRQEELDSARKMVGEMVLERAVKRLKYEKLEAAAKAALASYVENWPADQYHRLVGVVEMSGVNLALMALENK